VAEETLVLPLFALVLAAQSPEPPPAADLAPEPPPAAIVVDGAPEVHEVPVPDDVVGRLARPRMLDLDRYSLYADRRRPDSAGDGLRFDTEIEVVGRAKDPNEAMAVFWRQWNFEYSIYGHDINIQPKVAGGYNLLPIIDWLRRKARGESVDLWGRTNED
jgi:hypothetical protein